MGMVEEGGNEKIPVDRQYLQHYEARVFQWRASS